MLPGRLPPITRTHDIGTLGVDPQRSTHALLLRVTELPGEGSQGVAFSGALVSRSGHAYSEGTLKNDRISSDDLAFCSSPA